VLADRAIALIVFGIGAVGLYCWTIVGWGAFRKLNVLSKTRSFLAFITFQVADLIVGVVAYFLGSALREQPMPMLTT
jgi:hypothetical protein